MRQITILGFISHDNNTLPNGESIREVGGKGYYTSAAASRLGVQTVLITWLPPSDQELLTALRDYPIIIHTIDVEKPIINTNKHKNDQTKATTQADNTVIEPKEFSGSMKQSLQHSDIVHLAPDIHERISPQVIHFLKAEMKRRLSIDMSRYLRSVSVGGELIPRIALPDQGLYLQHFEIAILSLEDLEHIVNDKKGIRDFLKSIASQGPKEVILTMGSSGALIYNDSTHSFFEIPPYLPRPLVDPTGARDTFIGAYLALRENGEEISKAGHLAAVAAGYKIGYQGPLKENLENLTHYLNHQQKK